MKKVLFVYTDWNSNEERRASKGYGGVTYYRVVKPAEALRKLGWEVTVAGEDLTEWGKTPEEMWPAIFSEFDLVIVKQIDNPQAAGPMFFFAERYDTPVVMDLDDDYFAVKPDQPAWEHFHPGSTKRAIFGGSVSLVDAIFVSTDPLKGSYARFLKEAYQLDKDIFVLPNCNVLADWPTLPVREAKDEVVIGYAGSITHNSDLAMVIPALEKVMQQHKNVRFEVLGALNNASAREVFGRLSQKLMNRVSIKGGTHSWEGYPELLSSQNWDIGIAPLVDDTFTRGKSHIKWMEYTMAGIPTVASPVYPYIAPIDGVSPIKDRETGFFCRSKDEWVMVLSELVTDVSLRQQIARQAKEAIQRDWQYDAWAHKWAAAIDSVLCNFQTQRTRTASSKTAKTPVN